MKKQILVITALIAWSLQAWGIVIDGFELTYISGTNDFLPDDFYIGSNVAHSAMILTNAAHVYNDIGVIGYQASAFDCSVSVTDAGSVWSNANALFVGYYGHGNALHISNGGRVENSNAEIGFWPSAVDNAVVVSGSDSVWRCSNQLTVGDEGAGNSLVISEGGRVTCVDCDIGGYPSANGNRIIISGTGSVLSNSANLCIGGDFSFPGGTECLVEVVEDARAVVAGSAKLYPTNTLHIASGGTLVVSNDLILSNATVLAMGLDGRLVAHGQSRLGGMLVVELDGAMPTNGASFPLFDWAGGILGRFDEIHLDELPSESAWNTNDLYSAGILHVEEYFGATYFVDLHNPSPALPYDSWEVAATNIQDAVDQTRNGDTVFVAPAHYILDAEITINNDIELLSTTDPEFNIIDGSFTNTCLTIGSNACFVSGFTISNGFGGIACADATPIVFNCILISNMTGGTGGGMYLGTALDCRFIGNRARHSGGKHDGEAHGCVFIGNVAEGAYGIWGTGGGMSRGIAYDCTFISNSATYIWDVSGSPGYGGGMDYGEAHGCVFIDNSATYGGGMSECTAFGCSFEGNAAAAEGGGTWNSGVSHCSFDSNSADVGGGIWAGAATNCLFIGNYATNHGGGMYNAKALSCTFAGNSAGGLGGGTYMGSAINSISWHNAGSDLHGTAATNTCSPNVVQGTADCITNEPVFIPGTFRLRFDSPCITAGNNTYVSWPDDLDVHPRIENGIVDLGAYEYHPGYDSDGDGIPDWWEDDHFSSPTGCVATANSDGDPHNNLQEYIAGSHPHEIMDYLRIVEAWPIASGHVIEWAPVVEERHYTLLWTNELTSGFAPLIKGIEWPHNIATDTVHATESEGFYRIEVELK